MSRRRAKSKTPQGAPAAVAEAPVTPGRALLLAFLVLCLVGLAVAIDLTYIHVKVHVDPSYTGSFCAVSPAVNCDKVAESRWSVLLGVPVSVWGMLGYTVMGAVALALLLRRGKGTGGASALLVLAAGAAVSSAILGTISALAVHSFCILCLCTYAINATLLGLALLPLLRGGRIAAALRQDWQAWRANPRPAGIGAALAVAAAVVLLACYPPYWKEHPASGPGGLPTGATADGNPWIGAASPTVTVVEFSDYQCPHCRRGHKELRRMVEQHPQQLRLVHRHFPLDEACNPLVKRPFHARACELARLVVCAEQQRKAWEANDLIFAQESQEVLTADGLARQLGLEPTRFAACLADPASLAPVKSDVAAGMALGVRGTPTYAVGGKVVSVEELNRLLGQGGGAAQR